MAQYDDLINQAADKYGVDPSLLWGLAKTESGFDPKATSPKGAMGLLQLMPDKVKQYGIKDPYDPAQNVDAGTQHLKSLLDYYKGDTTKATAAYNAGRGAVDKYGGVPPFEETKGHLQKVNTARDEYRASRFQYVPLPDGSYAEFPKNMPDEKIQAALNKADYFSRRGTEPPKPAEFSALETMKNVGKIAGDTALTAGGQIAGGTLGALTPIPGGTVMGAGLGGAGGQYLSQQLGLAPKSAAQVGIAGAIPILGPIGKAMLKTPIGQARAAAEASGNLAKYLPEGGPLASKLLYAAAEAAPDLTPSKMSNVMNVIKQQGLADSESLPVELTNMGAHVRGQALPGVNIPPNPLAVKDAQKVVQELTDATFNRKITAAERYKIGKVKDALVAEMPPEFQAANEAYHRTKSVGRLQELIETTTDPAKAFKDLRKEGQLVSGAGSSRQVLTEGTDQSIKAFKTPELNDIQRTLDQLPKHLTWRDMRVAGAAGAVAGSALHSPTTAGLLAGMVAIPYGRRVVQHMIADNSIQSPKAIAGAAQLVRSVMARTPNDNSGQ